MNPTSIIYSKLTDFIKKYYTNELLRGFIFFIGLGLIYFFITTLLESFLWLNVSSRTLLFVLFVLGELFLFIKFIIIPILYLFNIRKGLSYEKASTIIGTHFSLVNDSLVNFLQLNQSQSSQHSELLLASIDQKAKQLQPIPFTSAVSYASNKRHLPLLLLPLFVLFIFILSGNFSFITQPFDRLIHFNTTYSPPAPFQFIVLNKDFTAKQNADFTLQIKVEGDIIPDNVKLIIDANTYYMNKLSVDSYDFTFTNLQSNQRFILESNGITSKEFNIILENSPSISDFKMTVIPPAYLNLPKQVYVGTGNAVIPEGSVVVWDLLTSNTDSVSAQFNNQSVSFYYSASDLFHLTKTILSDLEYQILLNNKSSNLSDTFDYSISITKDEFPSISVQSISNTDTIQTYLVGNISDDYGFSKLQIVYFDSNKPKMLHTSPISFTGSTSAQFVFSFPANLPVVTGVDYQYYFQVFDNDVVHNFKSSKTTLFSTKILTPEQVQNQIFLDQNNSINNLQNALKLQSKQEKSVSNLQKLAKQKDNFNFNDQQNLLDFIKRQEFQDNQFKDFSEKLRNNLDKIKDDNKDAIKQDLEKRLDNAIKEKEKNAKLLDELKKLNDKLDSEKLSDKLDNFKNNIKEQHKNLEQLVELTKKYYVEKKAEQLIDKLNKLAQLQENLSNQKDATADKQEILNSKFDQFKKELSDLKDDNKSLKNPLDLPKDSKSEESISQDMKSAKDNLDSKNEQSAKTKQKSAAKKMKELSQDMASQMQMNSMIKLDEDIATLRQILDNLLAFSLSQESLMYKFQKSNSTQSSYNTLIKSQQNLKDQFKHVEDSLFALSLRNTQITENITSEIGAIEYNLNNSITNLTNNGFSKGLSHQQYTISAANRLGDFLSGALSNMQTQKAGMMSGKPMPGQGNPKPGSGMQLPDIISKQKGIGKKMEQGMQNQGKKPGDSKGSEGGTKPNSDAKSGESGESGAESIMEIYKQQQQLRNSLEQQLSKSGNSLNGNKVLDQMKAIEKQLLNQGITNALIQKSLKIEQDLLKLDTALQEQNQDNQRKAEVNSKDYFNTNIALPQSVIDYLRSTEILERQSLPLQPSFIQKIQYYFSK